MQASSNSVCKHGGCLLKWVDSRSGVRSGEAGCPNSNLLLLLLAPGLASGKVRLHEAPKMMCS